MVCGVTTNICVETTVRDASQRDFRTFVVRDAVGEVDDFRGQTALKAMEYLVCPGDERQRRSRRMGCRVEQRGLGRTEMTMELGRDKTALVVVDMQNSYCRSGGRMEKLGFPYERLAAAEPGCKRMVAAARQAGVPVIYTQYVYQSDFKDGGFIVNEIMPGLKDVGLCELGTWDAEIIESLTPTPGEWLSKRTGRAPSIQPSLNPCWRL